MPLGGPGPEALLAALTQHPRQVLSIENLIDLIWDESPPDSATALVHTYVSALRRGLAAIGRQSALVTRSPGYLFDVQRTENDLEIHDRHLDVARRLGREGDHAEAMKHYQRALALWRARTLRDLAAAESETDPGAAARHWGEAIEAFTLLCGREAAELAGTDPRGRRAHVRRSVPTHDRPVGREPAPLVPLPLRAAGRAMG